MITTIHGLYLRNQKVLIKAANNHLIPIHRRQGDLDGACAVYSTIMCMLHIGYLMEPDLVLYNAPDRRTPKGKIVNIPFTALRYFKTFEKALIMDMNG